MHHERTASPSPEPLPTASRTAAIAMIALAAIVLPRPAEARGTDWVEFVEETGTRISADPSVGISDTFEKDLATGDVDNDGDIDLVIVRKVRFTVAGGKRNVLFMNESGVMVDRTATLAPDLLDETDDRDVVLVDLNGDGWLDMVTAGTFGEQSRVVMNLGEDLGGQWLGFDYDPARLPVYPQTGPDPDPKFCSVSAGDVTGDERPDLYFADYDNDLEDRLLINDGSGFFTDQTAARMTPLMVQSTFATDSAIADMNGDTFADIVKDNASGSFPDGFPTTVTISYNDGTGHFTFRDVIYDDAPYMTQVADFTQDGKLDLFVVDDSQDAFLINTGNNSQGRATFSQHTVSNSPETFGFGGDVQFADLDRDGILDVLVADVDTDIPGCGRRLTVLRGVGTPPNITYTDPFLGANRPWLPSGTFHVAVFDINKDHAPDIWAATCDGNRVFMGISPLLFEDGFESGDVSAWSATVP